MNWMAWDWARFGAGIAVIVAAVTFVLRAHGIRVRWAPAVAIARAIVQLAVISLLLGAVLAWPWLVLGFIVLMLTTASLTGSQRAAELPGGRRHAVVAIITGGVVATAAPLVLGLVDWDVQRIVAVAGISIGNAMSASTLAARNYLGAARAHMGEIEGWLSLGATPSQSTATLRRRAVQEAMIPSMDQTRNTGLVTLPGAFVGALFAGLSPVAAGVFQVTILAAVLLAQAVATTVLSTLVGRERCLPAQQEAQG